MNRRVVQAGLFAALLGGVFFGGGTLMDATMTRHDDVPDGSRLEVELSISMHAGAEASEEEIVEALVVVCQLEVSGGGSTQDLESLGDGNYRLVMTPGLDEADRRQLTGCLQDLRIDNVLANVVSMTHTDGDGPSDDEGDDRDNDDNGK